MADGPSARPTAEEKVACVRGTHKAKNGVCLHRCCCHCSDGFGFCTTIWYVVLAPLSCILCWRSEKREGHRDHVQGDHVGCLRNSRPKSCGTSACVGIYTSTSANLVYIHACLVRAYPRPDLYTCVGVLSRKKKSTLNRNTNIPNAGRLQLCGNVEKQGIKTTNALPIKPSSPTAPRTRWDCFVLVSRTKRQDSLLLLPFTPPLICREGATPTPAHTQCLHTEKSGGYSPSPRNGGER